MKFLDDWQLVGMATWELPIPQGSLFANPQLQTAVLIPVAGVSVFVPLHYPLTSGDELLQMMVAQQAQMARQAKLDPSRTALPHFKAYARMVDVLHWERVVTERYGQVLLHTGASPVDDRALPSQRATALVRRSD